MNKKASLALVLVLSFFAFANLAIANKAQIIEDVLTEKGFYDADEIELRSLFAELDNDLPLVGGGTLFESGTCNYGGCTPGVPLNFKGPQGFVPTLNNVTGIEINGSYTSDLIVKFNANTIPQNEFNALSSFQLAIIKTTTCQGITCTSGSSGSEYNVYSIVPELRPDGDIKRKQFISLKGLELGDYMFSVRAVYNQESVVSDWSNTMTLTVGAHGMTIADLPAGGLKSCLINNGNITTDLVASVERVECSGQQLNEFDVNHIIDYFTGVRYINISNNPLLTAIPGIGGLPHLKILDISDNPNIDVSEIWRFGRLDVLIMRNMGQANMPMPPHNAVYIDYSDNQFTSWSSIYMGRRDNAIQSLNLSNTGIDDAELSTVLSATHDVYIQGLNLSNNSSLTSISPLSLITELQHVNLDNTGLYGSLEFTGINGLCSLSISQTEIIKVTPVFPVQYLNLKNNTELRLAKPLQSAEYRPHWTDLTGSDALKCHKYYSYLDKSQPGSGVLPLTDYSIVDPNTAPGPLPQCETQTTAVQYVSPDICKPAPVFEANVYEDINTSKRVIHWQPNPSHDYVRWGVTHYLVTAYKNGNVLNEFTSLYPSTTIVTNSLDPDKYTVSICTEFQCGYNYEVTEFKQGLTKVFESSGFWNLGDSNNVTFQVKFKYPQQVFNQPFGKPDYFEITPGFNQPGHNDPIIIPVINRNGNCIKGDEIKPCDDENLWFSEPIPENQFIGKDFVIKACRNDIGCGQRVSVRLPNPLVSDDLPVPGLDSQKEDVYTQTEILLTWNNQGIDIWNSTHDDSEDIHYIEVTEEQPVRRAYSPFNQTPGSKTIVYYHELDGSNSLSLTRLVKGTYQFKLKACTRNRETGDICSQFSAEKPVELHRSNLTQVAFNRAQPSASNVYKALHSGDLAEAIIFEESNSKPDYYSVKISSKPGTDDLGASCGGASWTHGIIQSNNNNRVMLITSPYSKFISTYNLCQNPIDAGSITISSCFNGVGCNHNYYSTHVNYQELSQIGEVQFINNESDNNLNSNPIGGPGDMRPGAWWNPHMEGTGWHFYWANELRYPSMHDFYGETYDLLGVWLTYQLIDGDWSPVWMLAHLKKEDDSSNPASCENFNCSRYFEGDLTYVTRDSNGITHHKVGYVQVFFDSENSNNPDGNRDVLLKMDVDTNDGLLTMRGLQFSDSESCQYEDDEPTLSSDRNCPWLSSDGSLYMPLSNYDDSAYGNPNIGGTENDINHYSGMWSPMIGDMVDTEFTYMVDIIRNYEWAALLFYDNNGLPIWGLSDSCCFKTTEDKLDLTYYSLQRGFDPLNFTPEGWTVSEHAFEIGSDLANNRTFSDPNTRDYREMKLQLNVNGGGQWSGGRQATVYTGGQKELAKQASFHDIRFFINGQNENITECDPNTAANGECIIKFTWFTDDDFIDIKPFYRKDNGLLADLTQLCGLPLQDGYVVTDYTCTIYQPGNYKFELAKPSENNVGEWVTIAESKTLSILPCNSEFCEVNTYTPLEPVTESSEPYIGPDSIGNGNNNGILEWSDLPDPPKYSEEVGATEGSFKVSPMGAASYSIPIMTAPASGGLQPNLSINYNSQAGRGPMGLGWSIGGYSVISRCAQTFEQDYDENSTEPLIQSVTFTESDRFCVDGQRLMLVDGTGEYGSDGAEYRTEIDTITKYFSIGTQGSGPQCFEAWHKNGSKTHYGNCADDNSSDTSAFVPSGLSNDSALVWAQSQFTDDKGNFYTYSYYSSIVNQGFESEGVDFYLKEVAYTSNKAVTNQDLKGLVKFNYQIKNSNEIISSVISTNPLIKSLDRRRLSSIDTSYSGETIRHYKLNYNRLDTAGLKVLTNITECTSADTETSCLPSTVFEWGNNTEDEIGLTESIPVVTLATMPLAGKNKYQAVPFDANGDGLIDFHFLATSSSSNSTNLISNKIYLSNGQGGFTSIMGPDIPANKSISRVDINADGFTDFVVDKKVYLWNGNGYASGDDVITLDIVDGYHKLKYHDFNGDGLVDILAISGSQPPNNGRDIYFFENRIDLTITTSTPAGDLTNAFQLPKTYPVLFSSSFLADYESNMESGEFPQDLNEHLPDLKWVENLFDTNGDGVSELLINIDQDFCPDTTGDTNPCNYPVSSSSWVIAVLNSNGVFELNYLTGESECASCRSKTNAPTLVDLSNDGKPEVCYIHGHSFISEEKDFICRQVDENLQLGWSGSFSYTFDNLEDNPFIATNFIDYNGDGFVDLLYSRSDSKTAKWYVNFAFWGDGILNYSNAWQEINTTAGLGNVSRDDLSDGNYFYKDSNIFSDINNDGISDHLLIQSDISTREINLYKSMGINTHSSVINRDKIKSITNGLGEQLDITYGLMTDSEVYTRQTNSVNAWFGTGRSPVFDYISQMPLVSSLSKSSPAWIIDDPKLNLTGIVELNNAWQQKTMFTYKDAKLQAGGRGFLGFGEFNQFDLETRILLKELRRHDFPFTGSVYNSSSFLIPVSNNNYLFSDTIEASTPCWTENSCQPVVPTPNTCISSSGLSCVVSRHNFNRLNDAQLIQETNYEWNSDNRNAFNSVYVYIDKENISQYDLVTQHLSKNTQYNYEYDLELGYLEKSISFHYQGNNIGDNWLKKQTEINTPLLFNNPTDKVWTVKTDYKSIISEKINEPSYTQIVDYTYDENNLLESEEFKNPLDGNKSKLVKIITSRNIYGLIEGYESIEYKNGLAIYTKKDKFVYDTDKRIKINTKIMLDNVYKPVEKILQYNVIGLPEITQDSQGIKSFKKYDKFGKLYYSISEEGSFKLTKFNFGNSGFCPNTVTKYHTITTSKNGSKAVLPTQWTCFDVIGREIRTITQGFNANDKIYIDTQFDTSGNILAKSQPNHSPPSNNNANHWTRLEHDELGREVKRREPFAASTPEEIEHNITTSSYLYDINKNKEWLMVTNALGNLTNTYSNAIGEIVEVENAENDVVKYKYTATGKRYLIDGPLIGDDIITEYDNFDQIKFIDDPNLGKWFYKYNLLGQLKYQVDARGNCTLIEYDDAGKVTDKFYFKNATNICTGGQLDDHIQFTYGNTSFSPQFGQVLSESNNDLNKTYTYDELGRVDTVTSELINYSQLRTEQYFYDTYGRIKAYYDASGEGTLSHYNNQGYHYATQGIRTGLNYQTIYSLDAFGNITLEKSSNGVYTNRIFDVAGRLSLLFSGRSESGSEIQFMEYDYDAIGNMQFRSDGRNFYGAVTDIFEYDKVNRLKKSYLHFTDESGTHQMADYDISYDAAGRRETVKNFTTPLISYTYDPNHLHAVKSTTDGKSYWYDDNGNQTNSDGRIFTYTTFNKVKTINKGMQNVEYSYGANSEKMIREDRVGSDTKLTWYIGNVEIINEGWENGTASNIKINRYIGNHTIVTHHSPEIIDVNFLHKDHLGSIQAITSQGINTIKQQSYDAFGKSRSVESPNTIISHVFDGTTNKGFNSQDHINGLSLINFNARLYDPKLGMMLQADTIIPKGPIIDALNRYAYVFNNPLSYTDPSGHQPTFHGAKTPAPDNERLRKSKIFTSKRQFRRWKSQSTTFLKGSIGYSGSNLPSGTNPSSYSFNDMVRGNDSQFARLSSCGYDNNCLSVDGFNRLGKERLSDLGLNHRDFNQTEDGFRASLFHDDYGNGGYVVVFAGTNDLKDMITNYYQSQGILEYQYSKAIEIGSRITQLGRNSGSLVRFTGHSLGGGLASASAIANMRTAVTFNSAGLNPKILGDNAVNLAASDQLIKAYFVKGEFLSTFQDSTPNSIPIITPGRVRFIQAPSAIGRRIPLSPKTNGGALNLHKMTNVCKSMGVNC